MERYDYYISVFLVLCPIFLYSLLIFCASHNVGSQGEQNNRYVKVSEIRDKDIFYRMIQFLKIMSQEEQR